MNTSRNPDLKNAVNTLLDNWTIEVTPGGAKKIDDFRNYLRLGTTVYITFLPGSDFADTLEIALRLKEEGMKPVPHLAARSIPSSSWLKDNLDQLKTKVGLDQVLLIGGGVDNPVGDFSDTMQLLDTGLFEEFEIPNIGIAGHPEGSPDISDENIKSALLWKNDYAKRTGFNLCITTQFVFEAGPVIEWEKRVREEGNTLPIRIGIPGIATIKTLLNHARACGVGPSIRFLTRQAKNVAKLVQPSSPDILLLNLARHQIDNESLINGIHVYPLGGLKKSAAWFATVGDEKYELNDEGDQMIFSANDE
ncbi:MAG: metFprotein [Acidiferrobacteraceae bacterium]|nr:metFprotein [Acidiferrobacteraceae bacterium]|tara:strand:- start:9717 stop:10637 length:921 start_codon:yes stop_codon:yes gene_type:complete